MLPRTQYTEIFESVLYAVVGGVVLLQTAIVFASENGLKVSVEDAKCVLANAFIQAALFQQFTLREEQITFKINLTVLMVWSSAHSPVCILRFCMSRRRCEMFLGYARLYVCLSPHSQTTART